MSIGSTELLFIALCILIVFGAKRMIRTRIVSRCGNGIQGGE